MALDQKYQKVFRTECNVLSQMVLGSLLKLASNPKGEQELSNLVQAADTIIGDARFLQDKELEQNATMIVKSFNGVKDVRKKIDEYTVAIDQFGRIAMKTGAVPRGYRFVNGTCTLDNADHRQVEPWGLHENNDDNIHQLLENPLVQM